MQNVFAQLRRLRRGHGAARRLSALAGSPVGPSASADGAWRAGRPSSGAGSEQVFVTRRRCDAGARHRPRPDPLRLGVVDGLGRAGRCAWSPSASSAPRPTWTVAAAAAARSSAAIEAWLDEHRPGRGRRRAGLQPAQRAHRDGHRPGQRGRAAGRAARRGLPVALHTPSEVKAAVTGSGRADKAQVGAMVTRLLRLDAPPKPADAADALALAICHIWRGGSASAARSTAGDWPQRRAQEGPPDDRLRRAAPSPHVDARTPPSSRSAGSASSCSCTPDTLATLRDRRSRRRCRPAWSCARTR